MTPSSPWASVIVPIKDERENLSPLLTSLLKVMDSHETSRSRSYEILCIDDGSSDATGERERAGLNHDNKLVEYLVVGPFKLAEGSP